MLVCLTAVVLLAKKLAPSLEAAVTRVGAPDAVEHLECADPGLQSGDDRLGLGLRIRKVRVGGPSRSAGSRFTRALL